MYEKNRHTNTHTNVLKKHAYKHAYKYMKKTRIQMYDEVNCHASICQPNNPSYERWVGIELPTLWLLDDHTHHCATADSDIKMHTNVWQNHAYIHAYKYMKKTRIQMNEKKHAYKCMTKTRLQNRIQMYDKNPHTNVWQKHTYKHAYKCMKKTCMQMYEKKAYKIAYKCITKTRIQMYDKNMHTNVWKKTRI